VRISKISGIGLEVTQTNRYCLILGLHGKIFTVAWLQTGRPIGDLCSSYSTLPTEGELRGTPIVPLDILYMYREWKYSSTVASMLRANDHLHPDVSSAALSHAINNVMSHYLASDIAAIPLPEEYFSITIVHDGVPKHSATIEDFLYKQLPEILRVTTLQAYIYPLHSIESEKSVVQGSELSVEHSNFYQEMESIAEDFGFSITFRPGTDGICAIFDKIDPKFGIDSNWTSEALFRDLREVAARTQRGVGEGVDIGEGCYFYFEEDLKAFPWTELGGGDQAELRMIEALRYQEDVFFDRDQEDWDFAYNFEEPDYTGPIQPEEPYEEEEERATQDPYFPWDSFKYDSFSDLTDALEYCLDEGIELPAEVTCDVSHDTNVKFTKMDDGAYKLVFERSLFNGSSVSSLPIYC